MVMKQRKFVPSSQPCIFASEISASRHRVPSGLPLGTCGPERHASNGATFRRRAEVDA